MLRTLKPWVQCWDRNLVESDILEQGPYDRGNNPEGSVTGVRVDETGWL